MFPDLRIPAPERSLGIGELFLPPAPGLIDASLPPFGMKDFLRRGRLKQGLAVQIHFGGMHLMISRGDHPIAVDLRAERIVRPEDGAVDLRLPYIPFDVLPMFRPLGALDDDLLPFCRHIGDAKVFAQAAPSRLDPFPVHTLVDDHGIPRRGDICRPLDGEERALLRSGASVAPRLGNMINMRHFFVLLYFSTDIIL